MNEHQIKYQINKYRFILEAYSPIHIGSGERLDKRLDAVERNGLVYIIDISKVIELAKKMNKLYLFDNLRDIKSLLSSLNVDVGSVARYKLSGSLGSTKNEISTIIRLPDYKPYIPGSEVKGSIRTAILYYMCKSPQILDDALTNLSNRLDRERLDRKKASIDLEDKIFRNCKKDMHYDLLRSLLISDLYPLQGDANISLGEILLLTPKSRSTRTILLAEYISPSTQFYGNIVIRLLSDIDSIDKNLLISACREFSKDIVMYEKTKFNELKSKTQDTSISNIYDQLLNFYSSLENVINNGSTIIRLGYGEGHFSTTIGLLLYGNNKLYTTYKKLLDRLNVKDPISRRLIITRDGKESKIMPFGWTRIELQDNPRA